MNLARSGRLEVRFWEGEGGDAPLDKFSVIVEE